MKEFWTDVFEPTIQHYEGNRTPNPDVLCNRFVKFGAFHEKCQHLAGDSNIVIATGHYARTNYGEDVLMKTNPDAGIIKLWVFLSKDL